MLDLYRLACDACRLHCDSTKNFLSLLPQAYFAYLDHLAVSRAQGGGQQDRQHSNFGADLLGQGAAVLDSFPGEFGPVCGY